MQSLKVFSGVQPRIFFALELSATKTAVSPSRRGFSSTEIVFPTTFSQAENTSLTVDFGGGIKSEDDIRKAFDNGAAMVTVGSVAVTDRALFSQWLDTFGPERIVLGADVRNEKISINGWKEDSNEDIISFLDYYVGKGVTNVLCTDISKDGTLAGPAFELYEKILENFPNINLIASGGVSCKEDLKRLNAANVPSAILGKAIYEGKIDITTILKDI